jgi:glycosyltransferase involved in cell wall biosynthesis
MKFTLVSTTYNEISRLDTTIADIESQSILPEEIIIVDAGSHDGTFETLVKWSQKSDIKVTIIQKAGYNIAQGRNEAIRQAQTKLIVSTDFGCRYHEDWLKSLVEPFNQSDVEVVGGTFTVDTEKIQTLAAKADYILQNGYSQTIDDTFSVSSRSVAYYKYVWEQIGGYQEWLTLAADDTIFWRQVKQKKFKFRIINKPYVYWGRHDTFREFAKESYRYGLGDGESGINFRNFLSHIVETTGRYLLFSGIILIFSVQSIHFYWLLGLVPFLFGLRSYIRAYRYWMRIKSKKFSFFIFLASLWMIEKNRISYLKGYLKGYFSKQKRGKLTVK